MKTLFILTAAASLLIVASPANAQSVVRETTTTVQPAQPVEVVGTVTELVPDAISVRTEETAAPVRYTFTKTTEYVDEAGNRVSREIVKNGAPVTIRYVKDGDHLVVNRVIVRRQTAPEPDAVVTKKTTTTTTTTKE
jgi:hypothetical protein